MRIADIDVEYLDHMGDDLAVVNAARVSFSKEHDEYVPEKDAKLINYLAKHNHWSPFSHATVKFRIKAPIFVARQLVKHTVGFSWNEVSRRYVDNEPEFYIPDVWRKKAANVKQGSSEESVDLSPIEQMAGNNGALFLPEEAARVCLETYQAMLDIGVCAEQARMVLPQNTMTEWIWTGTLYAWARMCKLRLDSHTQKETRDVAEKIATTMASLYPASWDALMEA